MSDLNKVLVICMVLLPFWLFSQTNTVEYLTICENECFELSAPLTAASDLSYCWQKTHKNISDIYNSAPTICGITDYTVYRLIVSDPDGMLESEHYYHVYPKKVDLSIHHATVLTDGTTQAVSESDEETIGAMIPVNLDNDDSDSEFDLNDNEILGGDNEFAQLNIKISPASILTNTVQINSLMGIDNSIKLYKSNDKSSGEYILGEDLVLNLIDDAYHGKLWIEGVSPHTIQQQTKLELVSHNIDESWTEKCATDLVSLTIVGIEKLE